MNASRTCAGLLAAVLLAGCTAEHPEIDVFCAHDPAPLASLPARPAAHLTAVTRPRELTTVTRRDRVVPWMVCRSTP